MGTRSARYPSAGAGTAPASSGAAGGPVRLLLIEDNPAEADLVRELLKETGRGRFEFAYAGLLRDALRLLEAERFDAALLDLSLPDSSGLRTILRVLEAAPALPVVVFSGNEDEVLAMEAVQRGAQDYLIKGKVDGQLLARTIRYAIERRRLAFEVERQAADLRRNISKLKELDRLKDGFLASVSHELRTPLTSIKGFAQNLLAAGAETLTEEGRDSLWRIFRNAQRLQNLVNGILDLARMESGKATFKKTPVDLGPLVEGVLANWRPSFAEKRLRVRREWSDGLPPAGGDPDRIAQVLDNLVANAVKFTEPGGAITVKAALSPGEKAIRVAVGDTGIGIRREDLERIFEKFTQADQTDRRRYGGTGLGLSICREIVNLHGGRIWAESDGRTGSEFIFTLPLAV